MAKLTIKRIFTTVLLLCIVFIIGVDTFAQCPMCRTAAESNLKAGGSSGKGLNAGILYMLAMPYILVSTVGFLWWWNKKRAVEG